MPIDAIYYLCLSEKSKKMQLPRSRKDAKFHKELILGNIFLVTRIIRFGADSKFYVKF
jgi:hypothetical protein